MNKHPPDLSILIYYPILDVAWLVWIGNQACNPKEKENSKMLQYFIVQVIVTHKYWSVGNIVVRSGGGPDNWLFDRSLHDKVECLESKYMYNFNKYIVI